MNEYLEQAILRVFATIFIVVGTSISLINYIVGTLIIIIAYIILIYKDNILLKKIEALSNK